MSDRGFAVSPDPLSNGFVDNRDKRIAALEAENAALKQRNTEHEVIITTGTTDKHDGDKPDRVNVELTLAARCQVLEAENAALIAERDDYRDGWIAVSNSLNAANKDIVALKDERDKYKARYTEMRDGLEQVHVSLDQMGQSARHVVFRLNALVELDWLSSQLATARQSRARLVRLVRALRAELTTAWGIEAQAESERDAARAWAAAWKRAAKRWREVHLAPTTVTLRHYLDLAEWSIGRRAERRAQRISRAAEAMERR